MNEATRLFHPIKFRLLRVQAGMGRAELASAARIHKDTIKDWEQGKKSWVRPALASLSRAATALGCTVEDFLEPIDWVPSGDDLALLKAHMAATRRGYHWVGENPNPKMAKLSDSAETYVDQWLSTTH